MIRSAPVAGDCIREDAISGGELSVTGARIDDVSIMRTSWRRYASART